MRICIYGAGAIGGLFAFRLAAQGHDVSAIARGATLHALQSNGIGLNDGFSQGNTVRFQRIRVSDRPETLGAQDLIVIAVKQPALAAVAQAMRPLLAPHTRVLVAMNGVPWWFFDGMSGSLAGATLESIDPYGLMRQWIPTSQVIGCVVHISCAGSKPGVTRHRFVNNLILGNPACFRKLPSPELQHIGDVLSSAGFEITLSRFIQQDIWFKLWGNMTMNPVSALTGATSDQILDDPLVCDFCSSIMIEAGAIGAAIGCPIDQTPQARHAITRKLGAMKTSMLQDVEAGRTLEIDALLTVVLEIARRCAVPAPNTATLLGLIRLFAQVKGLR